MNENEINIIKLLISLEAVKLDAARKTFVFSDVGNESTIEKIMKLGFNVEEAGKGEKEIDLNELPFNSFYDEDDFLKRINRNSWNKSIFIYCKNIFYFTEQQITYQANLLNENFFLILNNHYCYKFFEFLKLQEHQESSAFYFVDYFSWDTYHLVLTSLKKDGKVDILLPKVGLSLYEDVKLPSAVSDFIDAFNENNKHYPKFIKTELIARLTKIEKSKRLETLLLNLKEIIYVASQNFEIYLHDLSLENLKKDFIEQKNKYFMQLRDILSKLTNQIIGLPIAIGVSVFSTYKVSDSPSTLFLVLFVFFLYALFTIYLLKLQKEDIQDLKLNFQSDFKTLSESEYFVKFSDELKTFEKVKNNLNLRINSLIVALNYYFLFASITDIAFTIYVENQLKLSNLGMVQTGILLAIGFLVIYMFTQTLRKDN